MDQYSDVRRKEYLLRTVDSMEMASGQAPLEFGFLEGALYGTTGAAFSAYAGIANTVGALGESIGAVSNAEDFRADTGDLLKDTYGQRGKEFYVQHSTGIEIAGLIAGSFIPGLGAIRGLRALQIAGKVPMPVRVATGQRNADFILGSQEVEAAKQAVLRSSGSPWRSQATQAAYRAAFKQQIAENLVFEAGFLLTMNQHATLNPEGLGYFEALGSQLKAGLPFVAVGVGIGTAVDAFRINGAIRKYIRAEDVRVAPIRAMEDLPYLQNREGGDRLVALAREMNALADRAAAFAPDDFSARRALDETTSVLRKELRDAITLVNTAGDEARQYLESIVMETTADRLGSLASAVAGLSKLETVSLETLQDMRQFYDKSRPPKILFRSTNETMMAANLDRTAEFTLGIDERGKDIVAAMREVFGDKAITSDNVGILHNLHIQLPESGAKTAADIKAGKGSLGRVVDWERSNGIIKVIKRKDRAGNEVAVIRISPMAITREGVDIDKYWRRSNDLNSYFGFPEVSREDFVQFTLLHELSHVKSNTRSQRKAILGNITSDPAARDAVGEILYGSFESRGADIFAELFDVVMVHHGSQAAQKFRVFADAYNGLKTAKDKKELLLRTFGGWVGKDGDSAISKGPMSKIATKDLRYYFEADELLADGMSYLINPKTRDVAAKVMPRIAELLDTYGGLAKAWDDTKAMYHMRRKETVASFMPGIADIMGKGGYTITRRGITTTLNVPNLNRSFEITPEYFNKIKDWYRLALSGKKADRPDFLDADAQWLAASQMRVKDLINDKTGEIVITQDALPIIERLVTSNEAELASMFANNKILLQLSDSTGKVMDTAMSKAQMLKWLHERKKTYRDAILATNMFNEHEIARILNIEVENAIGTFRDDGWTIMDKWDLSKPQLVTAKFNPMSMADVEASTKSLAAVEARTGMIEAEMESSASYILGSMHQLMPDIRVESVAALSRVETRAGMLTNLRTAFDSVRTQMAAVGRMVEKQSAQLEQEAAQRFVRHSSIFNHRENMALRVELAHVDNLIRRDWYYLVHGDEGSYVVSKRSLMEMAQEEKMGFAAFHQALLDDSRLADDYVSRVLGDDKLTPGAVKVSKEVADFYDMHRNVNLRYADRDARIAHSLHGRQVVRDPHALYPPPRDLKRYKNIAFVQPNLFRAGADPRKFMIFAETEAELAAKVDAIKSKYGNEYSIFNRPEVEEYKKYLGEYEQGLVFDEIYFDSELARRGTASELIVSSDFQVSGTLERYHTWQVRKELSQLRSGVEIKYARVFQFLRRMDEVTGATQASSMNKRFKEAGTIYADSIALMLGRREIGGAVEDMYVKVSDFIGTKGSAFIDSLLGTFREDVGAGVTEARLAEFNSKLAENGFQPPFTNVMEAVLTSPDPQVSRALPSLVRTMNNLAGTMMLRLDMAHQVVTMLSTPILAMPVLMEAKQALRGTEAGARLDRMTTAPVPGTGGIREPSAQKLMMDAARAFFTPEGKAFMQELRNRGIISDYLRQYQAVLDFSQINGRHRMKQINDKIDQLATFGSKWSGFTWTEEFSRFVVAHSAKKIAEVRGISGEEMFAIVGSSVDKVHGIYIGHQRPQLFQGVVGQAIGLYQTYFFNFMQNMLKYVGDGQKKQALTMVGLQSSIFGLQSWSGFQTFNAMIGETNRENVDIYEAFDANDPDSTGAYFMFGLGSHVLGTPIDFYSRGNLAIRNALIVPNPLQPMEIPAVGMFARAVANIYNTAKLAAKDDVSAFQAIVQGLAHNGMNRPVQGLATIIQGNVTSDAGQILYKDSNYLDYNMAEEYNWAAMFARAIGTRPLNEAILTNHYYRQAAYQASTRKQIEELGTQVQLAMRAGNLDSDTVSSFVLQYERAGGDIQNFNAFIGRQFQNADSGSMQKFRQEMESDSILSRAYRRMESERSAVPPWEQ